MMQRGPVERGAIDLGDVPGGLDLQATLESGQSYLWWRADGRMYTESAPTGGDAWYVTTHSPTDTGSPHLIRARQRNGTLEWEATTDAEPILRRRLRLTDDLPSIRDSGPGEDVVQAAYDAFWGMRLVEEPPFPALVTFICSAQMRVERIHGMQQALRRSLGQSVTVGERTYHAYPDPETVAATSEADLRDLGLGYRAPYVAETARLVVGSGPDLETVRGIEYEDARARLTEYVGVGQKVADCVLLFALDFTEAVPLDTWIRKAISAYFPACDRTSYTETSRAIRSRLGGRYAGYAQTYLFHHLRTGRTDLA